MTPDWTWRTDDSDWCADAFPTRESALADARECHSFDTEWIETGRRETVSAEEICARIPVLNDSEALQELISEIVYDAATEELDDTVHELGNDNWSPDADELRGAIRSVVVAECEKNPIKRVVEIERVEMEETNG